MSTTFIADKGYAFVSQVVKEVADNLRKTAEHATTIYAQTMGMLDRTNVFLKRDTIVST